MEEETQTEFIELTKREKNNTINVAVFFLGVILVAVSRYGLYVADNNVPLISKVTLVFGIVACVVSLLSIIRNLKKKE